MRIVDTNIIAYLLIEGDHTIAARTLLETDPDWHSDAFILVEFCNVLTTLMRVRNLSTSSAREALQQAEQIMEGGLQSASHVDALTLANKFGTSAYDARFLVAAQTHGLRLVTEDVKLRRAAPTLTQSLAEALGE